MKIRAVDYMGNLGGGIRFAVEMLRAMAQLTPDHSYELISHGGPYKRYREIFENTAPNIKVIDLSPAGSWRNKRSLKNVPLPGKKIIKQLLGQYTKWHSDIPENLFDHCDVLWLPWIHWHRVPASRSSKVVASLHDAIIFEYETGITPIRVEDERATIQQWLNSDAEIVVSSNATSKTLIRLFGTETSRFKVVPLSGEHAPSTRKAELPSEWEWKKDKYLIYAANISPHKNHEVLFDAYAAWGEGNPLVLTGEDADLQGTERGLELKRYAEALGLTLQKSLIPLGYVPSEIYDCLLDNAWAMVMCSLAEGGGSFPVWEAMLRGLPVLCSDIPVMREHIERTRGEVIWFDPYDSSDLAGKLRYLNENYESIKIAADKQVNRLKHRTWKDVAREYLQIFDARAQNKREV
ncbi:MAG: hypothetical protein A2Z14_18150 [Chloroflexi bacterium RBG_16_48_8]|nr:MAG: hypothetical protein A2Z14_18150 [Chloroflexi bacterium RBG_16_48_8]